MQQTDKVIQRDLKLGIPNFQYKDLYNPSKLKLLSENFFNEVQQSDPEIYKRFQSYRTNPNSTNPIEISNVLVGMAPYLSRFVAKLFAVESWVENLSEKYQAESDILFFKKEFIIRRALKKWSKEKTNDFNFDQVNSFLLEIRQKAFADLNFKIDEEKSTAQMIKRLVEIEKAYRQKITNDKSLISQKAIIDGAKLFKSIKSIATFDHIYRSEQSDDEKIEYISKYCLENLEKWCAIIRYDSGIKKKFKNWTSFQLPENIDYQHLVEYEVVNHDSPIKKMVGDETIYRRRDGFDLTDPRFNFRDVAGEVDYCIYCHDRDKDTCSKGLKEKSGEVKTNPLGIELSGCPLEEKISEAHLLKSRGDSLAALSLIMIDNPMAPGTGHRICNDCMKSCIYQKQSPVNIPQIETGILMDVLSFPWGFEIYSFLTRWNPLNINQPYQKQYNGINVLVVGLGPAGYTLAHYLLNEGFGVVGIDGLKIEPLAQELTGNDGKIPSPIYDTTELQKPLGQRVMAGFGGVSEYGITVRWDKNFLNMIYLTLARRQNFRIFGGVRFGGTLTIDDTWNLGFRHIAIATGAGKPTIINMKNNLIRGIRKASDFLMALQLTGAAKHSSMANLQVELPAIVVGGGLTAIDTATELMAYYPYQVEKFLERFEKIILEFGEDEVLKSFDKEEKEILKKFLQHGREVKAERDRAKSDNEKPNFIKLVRKWGGVKVFYRKGLIDSPAYRLNHEEIIKAFEEGIEFVEKMNPTEAVANEYGAIKEIIFEKQLEEGGKWKNLGKFTSIPARSLFVAAGTSPNIIYEREFPNTFKMDKWKQFFQTYQLSMDGEAALLPAEDSERAFFTSYNDEDKYITYYGDNHPAYAGNVVKAMASARKGYKHVVDLFKKEIDGRNTNEEHNYDDKWKIFSAELDNLFSATVVSVNRLTSTIVEVIVRAPMQAKKFLPGQFYRIQNFEADSVWIEGTQLTMEGLALTGAWTDAKKGLLSVIVLEMGASSRLVASLKPGQKVVVMGPTGTPTEIPQSENVLLAGGGLGNAVLFSIAKALRESGNKVIYFAGYKLGQDLFKREEIESSTDQIIWSTDGGAEIIPNRPQDSHFRGNIVQAMKNYGDGKLGEQLVPLPTVTRIIAIGSDRMMSAVRDARHGILAPYLSHHTAIGSINAPMQCMMKEVCAQCLIRHVDPVTGVETKPVFTCFNQDQHLDEVDFQNLNSRLRVNSVLEKLSNKWLDYLLKKQPVEMI